MGGHSLKQTNVNALERFREMAGATEGEQAFKRAMDNRQTPMSQKQLWAYFAKEIRARPQWVAEQTGIEQIGYLSELKPLAPLPSLDALEETWRTNAKCSKEQMKKVLKGWKDFRHTTKISDLRAITPTVVVGYLDIVHKRGLGGKQQSHIFGRIRRLLNFNLKRAIAAAHAAEPERPAPV